MAAFYAVIGGVKRMTEGKARSIREGGLSPELGWRP